MKTVKSRLFKKYLKRRNRGHGFVCLLIGYISEKKNIQNCNNVDTGAHTVGKVVFGLALTLIFPIIAEREKGKLYILKKVCLSTFKGIL